MDWLPIKFDPVTEALYRRHLNDRFMILGRLAMIFGVVSFIGYFAWDLLLDPDAADKTIPIRAMAVVHFSIGLVLTFIPVVKTNPKIWPFIVSYINLGYSVLFVFILDQLPSGFTTGVSGFLLGMILMPVMTSGIIQAAGAVVPQLLAILFIMHILGASPLELFNVVAWCGGGASFTLGFAYFLDVINRRAFSLEQQLEKEKQRGDELLLNILPQDVASRLKLNEEPLVDQHKSVSVLFTDLSGFTDFSRTLSASELVELLNDLFSRFDALVDKHQAEKIKTIGDAYMAVNGLRSDTEHAEKAAELAIDMKRAFDDFKEVHQLDLDIRIGIHSGDVIAGVIGTRKFSYDLWGDTVNVASRMESEGIPSQIQISEETKRLLPDRFGTTLRGEISIKGHRPRTTYLLDSK